MDSSERASKRGASNRRRGLDAERQLATYLREQGWPEARRAVVTGSSLAADPGDIAGVPGVIVSVKNTKAAAWPKWWAELDAMLAADPAALGVIVEKRHGHANPGDWWAHLRLTDLVDLATCAETGPPGTDSVRVTVQALSRLLIDAGYRRKVPA